VGSGANNVDIIDNNYTSASNFKSGVSGVKLVYELATPQTYQLTPQQIDLLLGTNHLWSDGEITVTYGVHPYYNPTPFDAKPLIKVTGTGTLGIGEYILTITGSASQTLYIDCETMEIYTLEGTVPTGASSLVSINKNDFPVLEPGTNNISVGSGITAVTITPRWWRI
jgi:phage-related protein